MEQNEELMKTWIGTKNQDEYYKKIHTGGFNVFAFLFPNILFIIRKMYIEAIILVILQILYFIALNILKAPIMIYILVSLTFCIISGFTYYYLYKWSIERKIKKYQKKNLSYEQQLEIARNNSGNKITLSVVGMFIATAVIVIVMLVGFSVGMNYLYYDKVNNNEDMLIGKWHDDTNKITLVLNLDNTVEFYTDNMSTIYIKGTYTLEQQQEEYGDEYLLTISTTDRRIQGNHLTDSYITQFSLVTEDYKEMMMLNVITYTMYSFEKVG